MLCNQGVVQIFRLIPEQLTTLVVQNTNHKSKNFGYKMIDIASCTLFNKTLLDVE